MEKQEIISSICTLAAAVARLCGVVSVMMPKRSKDYDDLQEELISIVDSLDPIDYLSQEESTNEISSGRSERMGGEDGTVGQQNHPGD